MKPVKVITVILPFLFIIGTSCASADSLSTWDFNQKKTAAVKKEGPVSPGAYLLVQGLRFYRSTISRVDGERCRMYPSCSAYGLEAVNKHGFFIGIVMTADRLIHESNEMDHAPRVKVANQTRYFDPVSANDFWWFNNEKN